MRSKPLVLVCLFVLAGVTALWFGLSHARTVASAGVDESRSDAERASALAANEAGENAGEAPRREALTFGPTAEEIAAAEAAAKAKAERRLEGRVVGPDGKGVPNASVWATTAENWMKLPLDIEPEGLPKSWLTVKKVESDAEGKFAFEGLEPGPLRIAARADGFGPTYLDHLDLPEYRTHSIGDVKLETGVSVSGRVLGPDGQGLPGARILIAMECAYRSNTLVMPGRGVPAGTSGADGAFTVAQLAPGPWHLFVEAPGCMSGECDGRIERAGGTETGIVVRLQTGTDIRGKIVCKDVALPAGLRVQARALPEAPTEQEPAPALVGNVTTGPRAPKESIRPRYALVAEDGTFVLEGLKPNTNFRLTAAKRNDEGEFKAFPAVEPQTVRAGTRGVELTLKPESVLIFRVVDDVTGAPIEEMVVATGIGRERPLRDDKGEVKNRFPDGRVRYPELRIAPTNTKPIPLRVSANGYKDHENKNVGLKAGVELDLGEIRLVRERVVVATVVDAVTHAPIQGARVLLSTEKSDEDLRDMAGYPPESTLVGMAGLKVARTGENGEARVTSVPGKNASLVASAKGYRPSAVARAFLPVDADHALQLELGRGATVIAKVTDGAGHPVAGVGVAHRLPKRNLDDENVDAVRKSDAEGLVRFEALEDGSHGFRIQEEDGEVYFWDERGEGDAQTNPWIELGVSEGQTTTLELVAPPRGDVFGVVREGGRPAEGAHIKFVPRKPGEEKQGQAYWSNGSDPFSTVTAHDGTYKLEHLRCGEYSALVLTHDRRMATEFRVRVTPERTQHDFDLDISGVEGRVVDADGRPLAGIDVYCWRTKPGLDIDQPYRMVVTEDDRGNPNVDWEQTSSGQIRTDDMGRYAIPGLVCNEPLSVSVQGEWVESAQSPEFTLSAGEVRHGVDFKLRLAGKVQVTMQNIGNGSQYRNEWFLVSLSQADDKDKRVVQQTYVGGWNPTNTIGSILPGRYRVAIRRNGDPETVVLSESEVEVTVGNVALVNFDPNR